MYKMSVFLSTIKLTRKKCPPLSLMSHLIHCPKAYFGDYSDTHTHTYVVPEICSARVLPSVSELEWSQLDCGTRDWVPPVKYLCTWGSWMMIWLRKYCKSSNSHATLSKWVHTHTTKSFSIPLQQTLIDTTTFLHPQKHWKGCLVNCFGWKLAWQAHMHWSISCHISTTHTLLTCSETETVYYLTFQIMNV